MPESADFDGLRAARQSNSVLGPAEEAPCRQTLKKFVRRQDEAKTIDGLQPHQDREKPPKADWRTLDAAVPINEGQLQ